MARRHADHVANGGFYGLSVEVRGDFCAVAQDQQVLLYIAASLPWIVDRDERRGVLVGSADVESRCIERGIDFGRKVAQGVFRGASAGYCEARGSGE